MQNDGIGGNGTPVELTRGDTVIQMAVTSTLTHAQEIAAGTLGRGHTRQQGFDAAGVSLRTVGNWLQNPAFRAAGQAVQETIGDLTLETSRAAQLALRAVCVLLL